MLVLALAVTSGVAGQYRASGLAEAGATLTEGGVLTRDLAAIRRAARHALVEVLSCRENQSSSGIGARYAGAAIDADTYLPNMATEDFLPALSRAALERCAAGNSLRPLPRVKDTRSALIARIGDGTFVYPGDRFAPTKDEQEDQRQKASGLSYNDGESEDLEGADGGTHPGLTEDGTEACGLSASANREGVDEDQIAA